MRLNLPSVVLVSLVAGIGCSGPGSSSPDPGGSGGSETPTGASSTGGRSTGGAPASGSGGAATGGAGAIATGGAPSTATGGSGGSATDGAPGADASAAADAATGADASAPGRDSGGTVTDGPARDTGPINLEGAIPPYEGPPVGPEVKMDCPGDPTAGFMEYKDTFRVEHPYDLPVSARFSIDGGIYTFWVMNGDKRHNPTSTASNPRTEARYSQNFRTGIRMWSSDVFWEKNVSHGTVVMQVHTTTTGIGPVYLVANGDNVPPITGSRVPGGLFDRWINLKVLINAETTASQYWINNCPVASKGSGTRGDGNNYFKIGVYHCDSGTCRARVKNVHLYIKQ